MPGKCVTKFYQIRRNNLEKNQEKIKENKPEGLYWFCGVLPTNTIFFFFYFFRYQTQTQIKIFAYVVGSVRQQSTIFRNWTGEAIAAE